MTTVVTRGTRGYTGVFSDYNYRQWTVQRVENEAKRIKHMLNTTYDQVRGGGEGGGEEEMEYVKSILKFPKILKFYILNS